MIFVKTFKGYEDKTQILDDAVNDWVAKNKVDIASIQTAMSHEANGPAGSGDLLYTVIYRSDRPIP